MDLLKFCRRLQEVVTSTYIENGNRRPTNDELRDVLAKFFKNERSGSFPVRLMRPDVLWTFIQLAGEKFYAKQAFDETWCMPGKQVGMHIPVTAAEYHFMKRLSGLAARPPEQQEVLDKFIDTMSPTATDEASRHRAHEAADYAFKSIYQPSEIEVCYLSSVATALGLPLAAWAIPEPIGQVPAFCRNEVYFIRGLRVDEGNETLASAVLHRLLRGLFFNKLNLHRMDTDRLNPEEVRMATWMSVVIREEPRQPLAPFVTFVIEHLMTGGISLDNVRLLDAVEETNFDVVLAIHCHIQTRLVPILGKAFQQIRQ